ncbi:sulfotransferase family protein [Allorhodopirellula heiligendammensis]|uniref:Sulfotransferase domain protein n=1 Tax=Allorhodopirellula heiligendammensis TaxID=2714739 RepID=A0A5C6C3I0_9BACT|nr:sulfotransferase [Allorhodopirellula heiligendammensis]TWU18076.1 Sulfotransferase domain protein [Allorhodopirellula heiligendammensis]
MNTARQPYFIVGSVRAGTTLLRLMLDHHPRIRCFGEFEYAIDLLTDDDQWPSARDYCEYLSTERRFMSNGLEAEPSQTYPEIAQSLFDQMAGRVSKPINGAVVHRHFERLTRLWPDAKFIYLYRDGRDVAKSCMAMGWAGTIWHGTQFVIDAETSWQKLCQQTELSKRLEIKSEDVVVQPESTLRQICQFLGDEFDPAMLEFHRDTTYEAPDPALVDQWRRKCSSKELRLAESRIGDLLQQRGYQLSGGPRGPVSTAEQRRLNLQNRLGRYRFAIRRYGWRLWLASWLSKRFPGTEFRERTRHRVISVDLKHLK